MQDIGDNFFIRILFVTSLSHVSLLNVAKIMNIIVKYRITNKITKLIFFAIYPCMHLRLNQLLQHSASQWPRRFHLQGHLQACQRMLTLRYAVSSICAGVHADGCYIRSSPKLLRWPVKVKLIRSQHRHQNRAGESSTTNNSTVECQYIWELINSLKQQYQHMQ